MKNLQKLKTMKICTLTKKNMKTIQKKNMKLPWKIKNKTKIVKNYNIENIVI